MPLAEVYSNRIYKEQREWIDKDSSLYDFNEHRNFVDSVINTLGSEETVHDIYPWGGQVEDRRLRLMNNAMKWGEAHYQNLRNLKEAGISPQSIIELGVGKDASLVKNIAHLYPEATIEVIELSGAKIDGARTTLKEDGYDLDGKIRLTQGEAAQTLTSLKYKPDLIDDQCFCVNLPRGGPNHPTLPEMLTVISDTLPIKGHAVFGELATGNWDVQLNPKYSGDSEAEELLNSTRLFMHGDGAKNPGARFLGWGIRGASLWKGPEDIEQDVVEFTKGRLKRDPRFDKTLLTDGITHDSPEAHVLAYLVPMLIGGIHGFRIATENRASATPGSALEEQVIKLKRAEEWLQTMGKKYLEILRDPKDRVFASFPSLHWLTFEKTRA